MKHLIKTAVSVFSAMLIVFSVMSIALTVQAAKTKKVRVIIKNDTFSVAEGAAWDGVCIDDYVELNQASSMQSVVEDALNKNSCEFSFNNWGYLSTINGLSEYAANGSGGWMMTLNDWFTSEASTAYTVENYGIKDGDEIVVMYSLNWGADVGSVWGNADTHLKSLSVSNGSLNEEFISDNTFYTLTINNSEVKFTPEAVNKNYQVRIYKNEYKPQSNGAELNKNAAIEVSHGDTIYIGIGNPSWPTMEMSSDETVYEIKICNASISKVQSKLEEVSKTLLSKSSSVGSIGGEWSIIGLARSGYITPDYAESYIHNVTEYVTNNGSAMLHRSKSTDNSRVILALTALGRDVTSVGGYNLLEPLADFNYVKKQGINGAMWALIALDSHNYDSEIRQELVDYLLEKQTSQGGWGFTSDTPYIDYTAMAVTALAPYYNTNEDVQESVDNAIVIMSEAVDGDKVTSPESYAQILTALCAMGINSDSDMVFKNVIDGIMRYECENGFKHEINGEYNQMATEQCFYALADYLRLKEKKYSLYKMTDAFYDIDSDYKVDILDALLIQKHVALLADFDDNQLKNSDINMDGYVTIGDVTALQRYIASYGA